MTQHPDPDVLRQRLRERSDRGELWKAKELARSYAASVYDPALWHACGEVLLQTQDLEQAGRYLFFAGSADSAHGPAIGLYLRRADRGRLRTDLARAGPVEELPASVRRVLDERRVVARPPRRPRRGSRSLDLLDLLTAVVAVAAVGLGAWKALELLGAVSH